MERISSLERQGDVKARVCGYLRVSTDRQDVENQRLEILDLANRLRLGWVDFVEDTASGGRSWRRRALGRAFDTLTADDVLVVAELSRLGRSMLEIMQVLSLAVERGVRVHAAKGDWALDESLPRNILAMVLAMAAEIERELISQRTKAALRTKQTQGARLGRPPGPGKSLLDPHMDDIRGALAVGMPKTRIAARYDTTTRNLSRWLARRGIGNDGSLQN
ncbi:recombinase family protein [Thermodesulfobacteriota bacterium]